MAGTGSNCTKTAIRSTQLAEKLGADVSLQVVPYYNKPSQEGMYQHFKTIAESTSLPIILYNIPGRTGKNMEPETIASLAEISNIIGIKEAAGSVEQVEKIRKLTPDSFTIYSGDDGLTLDFMEKGAYGVISVASHCAGLKIAEMINKFAAGQKTEARQIEAALKPLFDVLFITSNPVPVKAALQMMGFAVGHTRLPLVDATQEERAQIKAVLQKLELVSDKI
jgi:4-hydroxy-tetrahydrodipicolinate synthase